MPPEQPTPFTVVQTPPQLPVANKSSWLKWLIITFVVIIILGVGGLLLLGMLGKTYIETASEYTDKTLGGDGNLPSPEELYGSSAQGEKIVLSQADCDKFVNQADLELLVGRPLGSFSGKLTTDLANGLQDTCVYEAWDSSQKSSDLRGQPVSANIHFCLDTNAVCETMTQYLKATYPVNVLSFGLAGEVSEGNGRARIIFSNRSNLDIWTTGDLFTKESFEAFARGVYDKVPSTHR